MPCGGIYPIADADKMNLNCFHCRKIGADHELIEWDAFIHGKCIDAFLRTAEGQIVVKHGHAIVRA